MITLTKDNFDQEIASGLVFVKFAVKNGCRPCTEFKSKYEQAENDTAKFCTYERETLPKSADDLDEIEKKYQIQSFPTVLLFENGELKWKVEQYVFFNDRDLEWYVLDAQNKLYRQKCFVEDLMTYVNRRYSPWMQPWTSKTEKIDDFILPTPTVDQNNLAPCESCQ